MKFLVILFAVVASIMAASTGSIDWSKIKPRHINPSKLPGKYDAPEGRITNGQVAAAKQFPYQAGLSLYARDGTYWCGASVISDRWMVTAAHCTDDLATGVDVYLGAWNRLDRNDKNLQIIFVGKRNIIIHEDWNSETITNDISLIKLPVAIQFNDYIQPIKLPKKASSYPTYVGELTIASGWGLISDEASSITDILRWIKVPIMSNSGCNVWYFGSIEASNICIKTTGGISICSGDSGGPLVTTGDEPVLIGATSFGIGLGCEVGWPGVFTRIDYYLDWIEEHSGVSNK